MVMHYHLAVYRDVHRAHDRAGAVGFAGACISPDAENAEKVGNPQHGAVRTGVFAPRSLDKKREHQGDEPGSPIQTGQPRRSRS